MVRLERAAGIAPGSVVEYDPAADVAWWSPDLRDRGLFDSRRATIVQVLALHCGRWVMISTYAPEPANRRDCRYLRSEISAETAKAITIDARCELPESLASLVRRAAPPPADKAPAASGEGAPAPTELPPAVVADPYDNLAEKLRKNRARIQAALLEFMKSRESAEFQDIAHHVHGDNDASDGAIRANVKRTNEALEAERLPIKFVVGSGFVFKEEQPE